MDERIALIERVATLHSKVDAAHGRVDKMELFLSNELKDIKTDLKDVLGHINRSKGWAAASLLIASMGGGVVAFVIGLIFKH